MTADPVLKLPKFESMPEDPGSGAVHRLADVQRAHIMGTLREATWIVGGAQGAAATLGLLRTTLLSKLRRLGIARAQLQIADEMPEPPRAEHDRDSPAPCGIRSVSQAYGFASSSTKVEDDHTLPAASTSSGRGRV